MPQEAGTVPGWVGGLITGMFQNDIRTPSPVYRLEFCVDRL
jgi:hypothetical protein